MKPPVLLLLVFPLILSCKPGNTTQSDVDKALSDSVLVRKSDSLFTKAAVNMRSGNIDSALFLYQMGLELNEKTRIRNLQLFKVYYKVGAMYHAMFKYEAAGNHLQRAKSYADQENVSSDTVIDINFKLAECKSNMKDFAMAVSLLNNNLSLIETTFPDNYKLKATAYGLLGGTYYNSKQLKESIYWSTQALQTTSRDDHQSLAKYYTLMGMAQRDLQQYDEALHSFNQAIRHDLMWMNADSENVATRYIFKASVFVANGNLDSALYYYKENLRIRKKVYGEKNINTFGSKYSIGQWFEKSGDFDSAAYYYHSSLSSLIRTFDEPSLMSNPDPFGDEMTINLVIGLVGKASSLKKMFEMDTTQEKWLELALSTFLLADSVFSDYCKNFVDDDPQLAQLESAYIPYSEMVDAAFTLHRLQGKELYLEHALRTMERSRAVVLQNSLRRTEAYGRAGISEEYQRRENILISERASILQHLSRAPASRQTDSLQNALLRVNDRHQELLKEIAEINPRYFFLKYDNPPLRLNEVQQFLTKRNAILIEYLFGKNNLYTLCIGRDRIIQKIIPLRPELISSLDVVRSELINGTTSVYDKNRFEDFCVHSNILYRILIGDVLSSLGSTDETIIISPDGPLHSFPFEALTTEEPEGTEVNYKLPYLFYKHQTGYAFSIGHLIMQNRKKMSGNKLIAFGYSGLDESNADVREEDALPGSEAEINAIRKIFAGPSNQFHLGRWASESAFKSRISNFNMVHLAIHGIGDTTNAMESHLVFRKENDSINDGKLYAYELYDLNLSSLRLAVLSSCETGVGKYQRGEGVMSIARSFAYSGCAAQIIALWKVSDQTTSEFMENFYTDLAKGREIGECLTRARIDYLAHANELSSHPVFWAAFIQMGDSNNRFTDDWQSWSIVSLVVVLLILAAGFYWKHLKKVFAQKLRTKFDRTIV